LGTAMKRGKHRKMVIKTLTLPKKAQRDIREKMDGNNKVCTVVTPKRPKNTATTQFGFHGKLSILVSV